MRIPSFLISSSRRLARVEWYLKEAVPLFILGTFILFVFHKTKMLTLLEQAATPLIVNLLGLPARTTESFIIGFLRRDYGAAGLFMLSRDGLLSPHQILVSLVTITLFIPCIAQFFMMIKERGMKKTIVMSLVIFPVAFGTGAVLNFVLNWIGM